MSHQPHRARSPAKLRPPEPWLLTKTLPWSANGGIRHLVEGGDQSEQPTAKLGFDPRNSQGERGRVISRCFNVET